ncbi:MAG: FecR domain-containing protein [Opitutus sp.]|nr:FecR domain-containing protein [Opitutus sp.]MCS6248078.1 FecR domain-containing protein [Opitutus sp.]MCS6274642.1 FecR domain-containing protein [Opitutus sp.]MCS6279088.1 FecR domain-containing protein [Opitutus sp.]MCS6298577.1 FecR domain-containing protein [Opitutus sp.]
MKSIRLTLSIIAAAVGALVASAQQAPVEAVISSFVGTVTVTAPGATAGVPAVVGQKLPEGSTVTTGEGANVLIQSHEGITTGLSASATAVVGTHSVNAEGVRTAVIDLKTGTTVSVLDPSKRKINNYGVRTPKGVAAARGTTYSTNVKVNGQNVEVTVNTLTGKVSFSIAGGANIEVAPGFTATSNGTSAIITNATQKEALLLAIQIVAIISETNPAAAETLNAVVDQSKKAGLTDDEVNAAKDVSKLDIKVAKASPDEPKKIIVETPKNTLDITIVSPSL